jgi:hypothetical protein
MRFAPVEGCSSKPSMYTNEPSFLRFKRATTSREEAHPSKQSVLIVCEEGSPYSWALVLSLSLFRILTTGGEGGRGAQTTSCKQGLKSECWAEALHRLLVHFSIFCSSGIAKGREAVNTQVNQGSQNFLEFESGGSWECKLRLQVRPQTNLQC